MLNNEIWKVCKEFNRYEISNKGNYRVKGTEKNLSVFIQNSGYKVATLSQGSFKRVKRTIHRLVAIAFLKEIKSKNIVNHINGNKLDNSSSNLEWVTAKENLAHAKKLGLNVYNKPTSNLKMKPRNKDGISSKYLGVTWDSSRKKWKVFVVHNKTVLVQKRFDCEIEAAKYRDSIVKLHKLNYDLNFI